MKKMFKIKVLNIATKCIFISTVKDVFMTDLQHLIKLKKKNLVPGTSHTSMPEGQRSVLPLGAILLFAHLLFAHPPVFAFETSSIFWMVVTWACSLGGGHYGLYFMLQLKRKQGFI